MRTLNEIIVHCSGTFPNYKYGAKQIDIYHRQKGWDGIGYHFVVKLSGEIEIGRPIDKVGAHCHGRNKSSIGICYVGGLDVNFKPADTRSAAQKGALKTLILRLLEQYPSISKVSGHNQYANKACPCFDAQKEYLPLLLLRHQK